MTTTSNNGRQLRVGLLGVGHGGSELISTFDQSPLVDLVAAADINPSRLDALRSDHPHVRTYDSGQKLCADPDVDMIWIATPNWVHAEQTVMAARNGKDIICYQPMGTTLKEAARMAEAADKYNVKLMIGGLHSFFGPIRAIRRLILSGQMGEVKAMHSMAYTDWMLAPRTPEESTAPGGGVVVSMAPHQMDTLRLLGGGQVRSVRGSIGDWSSIRDCTGYYSAFLEFEDGAVATMVYDGYGYFMTSELVAWGNDIGLQNSTPDSRAGVRNGLLDGSLRGKELERKQTVQVGAAGSAFMQEQASQERKPWVPGHIGVTTITCERGDIRQAPFGLYIYDDEGNHELAVEDPVRRVGRVELEEFYDAVVNSKPLYRDGAWGMATVEAQTAIVRSAKLRREIKLSHQVPMPSNYDTDVPIAG
jgi:phthalate 4,5-cis-dihydrodiol dehydrogenase